MHKSYLVFAAVFGGLAVALGAFGAHGLKKITGDPEIINAFQTGVQYQMYHTLALLTAGILAGQFSDRWMKWSATCFITGILLFSGSLYLITFLKIQETSTRFAGPLTPLGGLFFILGWLFFLVSVLRKK